MRKLFSKLALTVALMLAITLTFSCSSGGGGNTEQSYNYCVMADNTCLAGPFTVNSCKGQPSNSCPNGSSPSVGGSSSSVSSSSSKGSSSSSGGGGSFNENSQIYNYKDGSLYKGSGVIKEQIYYEDEDGEYHKILIGVGSVTNGIVNWNLPLSIPDEYLSDFLEDDDQLSCTSYPENIKSSGYYYVLTNSSEDYIGHLQVISINEDERKAEAIYYVYFSKAGKITCNLDKYDGEKEEIINIDAKKGWNKIYYRENRDGVYIVEHNTNNILTKEKELKWILILHDD